MEKYPPEILAQIYKNFSNPIDIYKLSKTSKYINDILKISTTKLEIEELLYLDIDWLNKYPNLNKVDDNIIFSIDYNNLIDFIIPHNLKKLSVQIFVDKSVNPDKNIIYDIIKNILIKINNIYEYTVRIILNYEIKPYRNEAIIIDLGNYIHLKDFNKNIMESRIKYLIFNYNYFIVNYEEIFDSLGIKLTKKINNSLSLYEIFYPNKNFSNFFNEIFPIIFDEQLTDTEDQDYVEYLINIKENYKSTGFISFNTIKDLILMYSDINYLVEEVPRLYGGSEEVIYPDDILNKYLKSDYKYGKYEIISQSYIYNSFKYSDGNISPAHYYITNNIINE